MRIDEIVILVLKYISNDKGEVEGKTLLQKVVYFLNEKLGLGIRFIPYYYGPYSKEVADALEELKSMGMIEEQVESYSDRWLHLFESRLFRYIINKFGFKFAELVEERHRAEAKKIKDVIEEINTIFQNNAKLLSIAGKMFIILRKKGKPMTPQDILEEAKVLNWEISEEEAQESINLLEKMKLIKKVNDGSKE